MTKSNLRKNKTNLKKIWEGVNEIISSRKIEKDGSISAIIAVGITITDSQKVKS